MRTAKLNIIYQYIVRCIKPLYVYHFIYFIISCKCILSISFSYVPHGFLIHVKFDDTGPVYFNRHRYFCVRSNQIFRKNQYRKYLAEFYDVEKPSHSL